MEELDAVLGCIHPHHGVIDHVATDHPAQRNDAVGHALGKVQHVGHHAIEVSAKGYAQPPKAGDDLVENQQDAVAIADVAKALEVTLRRHEPPCAARHRLDDDGGHIAGVMQRQDALLEFIQVGLVG